MATRTTRAAIAQTHQRWYQGFDGAGSTGGVFPVTARLQAGRDVVGPVSPSIDSGVGVLQGLSTGTAVQVALSPNDRRRAEQPCRRTDQLCGHRHRSGGALPARCTRQLASTRPEDARADRCPVGRILAPWARTFTCVATNADPGVAIYDDSGTEIQDLRIVGVVEIAGSEDEVGSPPNLDLAIACASGVARPVVADRTDHRTGRNLNFGQVSIPLVRRGDSIECDVRGSSEL